MSKKQEIQIPNNTGLPADKNEGAVIWITGFSGAGKTTVGRKVKTSLKEIGVNAVFFDGDDMRRIFAGKWGYDRDDRIELSHSYFRLCNSLSTQGMTVVISAVCMYEEIFTWVRTNVDRSLQVYLKVPQDERILRDSSTKNIYSSLKNLKKLYDEPASPDLCIENHGLTSPDIASQSIINAFKELTAVPHADKGREAHWNKYYTSSGLINDPSSFAVSTSNKITAPINLLEIGCGNGRDSAYFADIGNHVTALDPSFEAINLCRSKYDTTKTQFINSTLPKLVSVQDLEFDVIYSRFCFHAMTEKEEIENIICSYKILKNNGRMFIECRSINDSLARQGEVISPTERIHGHYRRFLIMDELIERITSTGFTIVSAEESDDFAVLGDEKPVIIRIHAKK